MQEYNFGYGSHKIRPTTARVLDRIARKHAGARAGFVTANMPEGPRFWFVIPNRGEPFDRDTAAAILAEATQAGFWPPQRMD
jgi:hypothetical protein